jgi:excinuclease ABC subunit C
VILRDDKQYPYLKMTMDETYPRLFIVRKVKKDGAQYFGPYVSAKSVRQTLRLIYKIFSLRQSKDNLDGKAPRRPCLNYQMGRCYAPCAGNISPEEYRNVVREVTLFLKGQNRELLLELKDKMTRASDELRYEAAAKYRDQIAAIENVIERQNITHTRLTDEDVASLVREGQRVAVCVLFVREGRVIGDRTFQFPNIGDVEDVEIFESFLKQFYQGDMFVPGEVIVNLDIQDRELIQSWLSERRRGKVQLLRPERGRKKGLVDMAEENARVSLSELIRLKQNREDALNRLQEILGLGSYPERIEAFDISNISGDSAVGSMTVAMGGTPTPAEYKRFRIKSVEGQDDYAMLREVIRRRYGKIAAGRGDPPDLILVDGGKGQVNAVVETLRSMGAEHWEVAGIAKGKDRNNPDTDEIVRPGRADPVPFEKNSPSKVILQTLRDEAHRFAVTYHRNVRDASRLRSELDDVPGIGEKRKKALLKHFGSMENIRKATVEDLMKVLMVGEKTARQFHERL